MGLHLRHVRLVLDLLGRQQRRGLDARFFEIGYGAGHAPGAGPQRGIPLCRNRGLRGHASDGRRATGAGGPAASPRGQFPRQRATGSGNRWSLVYWNDVFEHIPPDEIGDWLARIHAMLVPGGQLLTITPNWHVRPSDATVAFCPPRTGVCRLALEGIYTPRGERLAAPGRVPLDRDAAGRNSRAYHSVRQRRFALASACSSPRWNGCRSALARLLCRGMGLNCTIATKDVTC